MAVKNNATASHSLLSPKEVLGHPPHTLGHWVDCRDYADAGNIGRDVIWSNQNGTSVDPTFQNSGMDRGDEGCWNDTNDNADNEHWVSFRSYWFDLDDQDLDVVFLNEAGSDMYVGIHKASIKYDPSVTPMSEAAELYIKSSTAKKVTSLHGKYFNNNEASFNHDVTKKYIIVRFGKGGKEGSMVTVYGSDSVPDSTDLGKAAADGGWGDEETPAAWGNAIASHTLNYPGSPVQAGKICLGVSLDAGEDESAIVAFRLS